MLNSESYNFDNFGEKESANEIERLKKQATAFLQLELKSLKRLGIGPNMRSLEIGCGPGFIT
ncbi:hypothetical protein [Candidatus Uabimicrobium sp. HlEnr_7]|uniref:hypothetical protein n=1 Tax=Candidatus Uabimicrobium helgolandensis TaxID=3095367 RepID=UPI003557ABD6